MRTKLNFCGIFAIAFIAATIILVSSCSQDDDFYESDMYTMAEELETRAGEPGGDWNTPKPSLMYYYLNEKDIEVRIPFPSFKVTHHASCSINIPVSLKPDVSSEIEAMDSTRYFDLTLKERNVEIESYGTNLAICVSYYIRFRDRNNGNNLDSTDWKFDFIELDTISYPLGTSPQQPNN